MNEGDVASLRLYNGRGLAMAQWVGGLKRSTPVLERCDGLPNCADPRISAIHVKLKRSWRSISRHCIC
eukprot:2250374-Pyramimonas_sp.AAC.1